jgi:uncharacterized protein
MGNLDGRASRAGRPSPGRAIELKRVLLGLIYFYQRAISPYLGANCRYVPSCSAYAAEALQKYGCIKGLYLAVRRLLRCHPFGGHGFDPVP